MNLVARYEKGDHTRVWQELVVAGDAVTGELRTEALEVIRLTMQRVRRNVDVLVAELSSHGFEFGVYPDGEEVPTYPGPVASLTEQDASAIDQLETLIGGPLPLSILGVWRWVGQICFVGYADDWPEYADPIWIESPRASLNEYADRKWRHEQADQDEPFGLILAPDIYHKDNVSGGAPYEMPVPCAGIDGLLRNYPRECYLIEYLRQALAWGGFPGAEGADTPLPQWLLRAARELEPF